MTMPRTKRRCDGRRRWLRRVLVALLTATAGTYAGLILFVPHFREQSIGGWAWLLGMGYDDFASRPPTVFHRGFKRYLWGGEDPDSHFSISTFRLDTDRLHFGLGREHFHALIEPEFISITEADRLDSDRVLLVSINGDSRIYPLTTLRRHEVVNDTVGGKPIFTAFCVLADLGAAYARTIGDHTFTFGVSGYTYDDPDIWGGSQAFILWDRDTESLWWPPIGKAVSGSMIDRPMRVLDEQFWSQTTFGEAVAQCPDAVVLKPDQSFNAPDSWPRYEPGDTLMRGDSDGIAPFWGENSEIATPDRATSQPQG